MTDSVPEASGRMTSKFAVGPGFPKYVVRHSMMNWRFGALPVTAVKIPSLFSSVRRSPRYGINARSRPLTASGVHASVGAPPFDVVNCRFPLAEAKALVYVWP
jgi:hypothetical protein